jgi:ribose transport system substrate-binding protein
LLAALLVVAVLGVVACGDDESDTGGGDAGGGAAAEPSSAVPAEVTDRLAQYSEVPEFKAPGPAFDASSIAGKHVFNIPISSAIPFIQTIDDSMAKVAKEYDLKFTEFTNEGKPADWARGIEQAVNQKADIIVLQGAPEPRILQPQLKAAKEAGIPVVATHWFDVSQEIPPNVTANVPVDFTTGARLEADWVIADSEGKANALVIGSSDAPPSEPMMKAIQEEFDTHCPDCKLEIVDVPVPDWATKTQTTVQSALVEDPTIDYVIPFVDGMAPFATAAIKAAGKTDKVKIATMNGTPGVLKMIQDEDVVAMDVGESLDWVAWANMDQAMRILAGEDPVENENMPLRVFTADNVDEAGTPPAANEGYGEAYLDGYTELWSGGN